MKQSCKIAFVIPALNAEKTLRQCLTSIKSQILQNEYFNISSQVLVVDNGSTDATSEIANELNVPVIKENKRNRSLARNKGFQNVDAEWIAFIDSDTTIEENWALGMISRALSSERIGGVDSYVHSSALSQKGFIETLRGILKIGQNNLLKIKGQDYPMINSAACLYRKSALMQINGFDLEFNSYEDTDLSRRMLLAGWILVCNEENKAFCYNDRVTYFAFLKRYFTLGRYRYLYTLKWTPKSKFQTCCYEIESFFVEIKLIAHKILKNTDFFTSSILIFLMSSFLFSKMLGSLFMFFLGKSIAKINLQNFNPSIKYKKRQWGLVSYTQSYLLFDPIKKEFLEFKKIFDLNTFIKYCQEKGSHED